MLLWLFSWPSGVRAEWGINSTIDSRLQSAHFWVGEKSMTAIALDLRVKLSYDQQGHLVTCRETQQGLVLFTLYSVIL